MIYDGLSERQAKALTSALLQLINSQLVTRDHLDMKLTELRVELTTLRVDIAQSKFDLARWLFAAVLVQTGAIAALFKYLH